MWQVITRLGEIGIPRHHCYDSTPSQETSLDLQSLAELSEPPRRNCSCLPRKPQRYSSSDPKRFTELIQTRIVQDDWARGRFTAIDLKRRNHPSSSRPTNNLLRRLLVLIDINFLKRDIFRLQKPFCRPTIRTPLRSIHSYLLRHLFSYLLVRNSHSGNIRPGPFENCPPDDSQSESLLPCTFHC